MIYFMSYQYPATLPPNGPEMDTSQAGYASIYSAPATDPLFRVPRSHEQPLRARKESFSQTNVSDPSQAGDRKRSKLGYHRTSVACGHCRRRKIRCVPSPPDIHGRCINCIRLKKECIFYPVDQPPPSQLADTRPKPLSRTSAGPKFASCSESSSPAMTAGQSPVMAQLQQYQRVAMPPSAQNIAPLVIHPSNIKASKIQHALKTRELVDKKKPVSSGASSAPQFDFPNPAIGSWMPPDVPSSLANTSNMNETWTSYPRESLITSSFSSYIPQESGSVGWGTAINADSSTRREMTCASFVPTSSMPFPSEAQLSSQYAALPQGRSFSRKSSTMSMDMYPDHITTSEPGLVPQGISLSAGAVPPSGYGSWEQPYNYTKMNEDWGYDQARDH